VSTFYSTSKLQTTVWRVRDWFEVSYAFNRAKVTDDGAAYVTSDAGCSCRSTRT